MLGLGAVGSISLNADAASNGSLSVYPTIHAGQGARVVFNLQLTPGKTFADSVTVANLSPMPQSYNLYAGDALNTAGGGLTLTRRVDPVQGIGSWIRLSHSAISVPAHGQSMVPFVIVVPADATPGDHLGGIVAEQPSGTPASAGSVPISVVQAVGVRVYSRVKGPLTPRLHVSPPQLALGASASSPFGGSVKTVVSFRVTNDGNVVLNPHARLTISGTFGATRSHIFDLGPILPGQSVIERHSITVSAVGQVRTGVTVAADGTAANSSTTNWVIPWALVGIAILLLALALVIAVMTKRRRRASAQKRMADRGDSTMLLSDDQGSRGKSPRHARKFDDSDQHAKSRI